MRKIIGLRRTLASCFLVFLITVTVISLTKEIIVRNWLENAFKKHLSLDVKVQDIYIDLLQPRISVDGLYLLNPPQFGRQWLANISDVVLNYEFSSLFKKNFKVKNITVDILEVNIVKDHEGNVNLNIIRECEKASERPLDISIDKLNLSIRRVTYEDMTMAVPVKVYDLNLKNIEFKDIETLEGLAELIATKIFERIGVGQIGITKEDVKHLPLSDNPILQAGSFIHAVILKLKEVVPG